MPLNRARFRPTVMTEIMIWVIFGPLCLFSLFMLVHASALVARHLHAQSWQPVQGTLLERGVDREKSAGGGGGGQSHDAPIGPLFLLVGGARLRELAGVLFLDEGAQRGLEP